MFLACPYVFFQVSEACPQGCSSWPFDQRSISQALKCCGSEFVSSQKLLMSSRKCYWVFFVQQPEGVESKVRGNVCHLTLTWVLHLFLAYFLAFLRRAQSCSSWPFVSALSVKLLLAFKSGSEFVSSTIFWPQKCHT